MTSAPDSEASEPSEPVPAGHRGPFDQLGPEQILAAVEGALDLVLDGAIERFPSYINRVYGVRVDDGTELVAKFYRPGRWTLEAIEEEHAFLEELADAEVPVVAPIGDSDGATLFELDAGEVTIPYALFPKRNGRPFDAEGDSEWWRLGSLVGRLHAVSARAAAPNRLRIDAETWTYARLAALEDSGQVDPAFQEELGEVVRSALERVESLFDGYPTIRLHGDCHRGNIVDRADEGLLLIDFDDMASGPAAQDLWLLLPDHAEECTRELAHLLDGYRSFAPFDERQIELIEPLRFMRMVHFLAWQAHQAGDRGFLQSFPDWGSRGFWITEIEALRDQATRLPD